MAEVNLNIDADLKPLERLRKQLDDVKDAMVGVDDPAAFAKLQDRAGELQAEIMRVDTVVINSGSNFTNFNSVLGSTTSALVNLDFAAAAEQAALLQQVTKKLTFKEMLSGMKQTVNVLKILGKALLSNPIFLIASIIIAVGVALFALKDKIAIIGDAFEALGNIIGFVTDLLKSFTDAIGLTSFEAEEAAQKEIEAQEKKKEAYRDTVDSVVNDLNRQIKEQQALGKDTTKLEEEVLRQRRTQTKAIVSATDRQIQELEALQGKRGKLTDEEKEQLKELQKERKEAIEAHKDAESDLTVFLNAQYTQRIKDREEAAKKREEEAKRLAKEAEDRRKREEEERRKRLEAQRRFEKERLSAEREIRDLELQLMEEGIEKEIALLEETYKRKIEDTKNNETLLAKEKRMIIEQLQVIEQERIEELRQKEKEQKRLENQERLQEELEFQNMLRELRLQVQEGEEEGEDFDTIQQNLKERQQFELDLLQQQLDQKLIIEEEYNLQKELLDQKYTSAFEDLSNRRQAKEEQEAAARKEALNSVKDSVISSINSVMAVTGENAALSKIIALSQIAIDTAKGISGAISAGAGVPFPGNIPAIASGIASVLAGIASAYSALSKAPPVPGAGGGGAGARPTVAQPITNAVASGPQFFGNTFSGSDEEVVTGERTEASSVTATRAYIVDSDLASQSERNQQLADKVKFQ